MSEFKFACPVCGQHITADSNATGSQIECPTCYRKIVVPQRPSSDDPKFILSASEANRPRPAPTATAEQPGAVVSTQTAVRISLVLIVVLIGAIGTIVFVARGKLFNAAKAEEGLAEGGGAVAGPAPATNAPPRRSLWTLNLTNSPFPDGPVAGVVRGRNFDGERAVLQGGTLTLRQKPGTPEEMSVAIAFFTIYPGQLSGMSVNIRTNDTVAPRVMIRWKEDQQNMMQSMGSGYVLRMEFGTNTPTGMSGQIFLCLPDDTKSWIAGTFRAEVRRAPPPRPPRQQKTRRN